MNDYYDKVRSLSEEKLSEEIEKITKRLLSSNPASPVYNQLLSMLETAESFYMEKIVLESSKKDKDQIIEIGSIQSDEYTPDYSNENLAYVVAKTYVNDSRGGSQ
jgi:hypothetical protein